MEEKFLENYLKENYKVYDRFTFDKVFRFLLSNGYQREETKDIIMHNCTLSALVSQERIHNEYYYKISLDEEVSEDLMELMNKAKENILNFREEDFRQYLEDRINEIINSSDKNMRQ